LSDFLLARDAENLFWLARYVERAENLARILDVNATFSRDIRGGRDWLPVLQLNADERRFRERHGDPTADAVLRFYVLDRDNPTSIVSAIASARANAKALRPQTSREMWAQLNVLHNWVAGLDDQALVASELTRLLGRIREACQTHTGVTEGTFYRDQGWHFYWLGRYIERADQTTRLLDIKYHLLLPRGQDVGSALDLGQWNALLRSAAGYHAFRRIESGAITPAKVAGFLLLDGHFPRSVALCVGEGEHLLSELRSRWLLGGADALAAIRSLRERLGGLTIDAILAGGLHEFLDDLQQRFIALTTDLSAAFFGHGPAQSQGQSQRQGVTAA
jgi:uncharacterized alpha-E superfamily protein